MAQAGVKNRAMRASQLELEAMVAVARHGGFRVAARELDMSSSALSHAVAALETRLGVRLFNRTTRSVVLSAEGEQFVAEVAPLWPRSAQPWNTSMNTAPKRQASCA
jgi:DNA-binding transcriptional LysR family regulator